MNDSDANPPPVVYTPIGVIHSEHCSPEETPIQPTFARGCVGWAEIFHPYDEGLRDLQGFSHVYLIYHLHRAEAMQLTVKPFLQDVKHGVFATRFPRRPNPIGLSLVELLGREGNVLRFDGMDVLDGIPLLDIKPYAARFDRVEKSRDGWLETVDDAEARSRGRRGYRGRIGP